MKLESCTHPSAPGAQTVLPDSALAGRCPGCGSARLSIIYELKDIPVHSCLLIDTQAGALGHPRGDLVLTFCEACGFVANQAFDADRLDYSTAYEETQGFSSTFNAFASRLAEQWVERYGLHGRDVIEIGCGKGEFLRTLCELGDNRGIGFDPAFVPERSGELTAGRVEFIQDYYNERYAVVPADFICCRHTLEHISGVEAFVRMIRRSLADRGRAVVCFELPDFSRILDELAFWDIYYEHCSYFTLGSLARLFRRCEFDLLDLRKVYGGQYLIIEARAGTGRPAAALPGEDDLGPTRELVRRFTEHCGEKINQWRRDIRGWRAAGERIALWGSGSKAVGFLTTVKCDEAIDCVVDINPYKDGKYMPGCRPQIVAPARLRDIRPDRVIVMNPIYIEEIGRDLAELGIDARMTAL